MTSNHQEGTAVMANAVFFQGDSPYAGGVFFLSITFVSTAKRREVGPEPG